MIVVEINLPSMISKYMHTLSLCLSFPHTQTHTHTHTLTHTHIHIHTLIRGGTGGYGSSRDESAKYDIEIQQHNRGCSAGHMCVMPYTHTHTYTHTCAHIYMYTWALRGLR